MLNQIVEHTHSSQAQSYLGIASNQYGRAFDIEGLRKGAFDQDFKDSELYFQRSCQVFDNLRQALEVTGRRAVTKNSAYVVTLSCPSADIKRVIEEKQLTHLIIKVINAKTGEVLD